MSSVREFLDIREHTSVVTGASGFIGSSVVKALVWAGGNVIALVRKNSDLYRLHGVVDDITIIEGDLADPLPLRSLPAMRGSPVFFHLGAAGVRSSDNDAREIVRTNVDGTLNILELAVECGASKLIYAGSCFEYGSGTRIQESDTSISPRSVYAASKIGGWSLVNQFASSARLSAISLRLFNVYGPGENPGRLIPYAIESAIRGDEISLTAGNQQRDFIYVNDVVEAFVVAGSRRDVVDGTFNVCTGVATSIRDVVGIIVKLSGSTSTVNVGSQPERPDEYSALVGDPSHTSEHLGWSSTTDLESGLQAFIQSYPSGESYS